MKQEKIIKTPHKTGIAPLIACIDRRRPLLIQAHDFPDHDAVAAGFGLLELLASRSIQAQLCYSGLIQSNSLKEAIRLLEIPIFASSSIEISEDTQIILVDGFIGNRNVTDLPGEVIALIDHHCPSDPPRVAYWDIRTEYGSCATIIYDYYRQGNTEISKNCATSLLMGLMMDTAFMTRGVHQVDLEAFSDLFFQGDWQTGARMLKNSLSVKDLAIFREAMTICQVASDFCFIPLSSECSPEVAALVADFFLNIHEIHVVVVMVPSSREYRFSVRSEDKNRPCDDMIRKALKGYGAGGGHMHMGGGSIPLDLYPGESVIRQRLISAASPAN
jgi:nanoRNase/pAp phosphatase (c-di-AMP/oligoRNAs hydrolase)